MSNERVSFILPSRNEKYLTKTILDILQKCEGDVEVIAVLEGYWPDTKDMVADTRVKYIHNGTPRGMRGAINQAAAIATGKYIAKCDAHVMISQGLDKVLVANSKYNRLQVPTRRRLDAENWCEQIHDPIKKPPISAEYLSYPEDPNDFGGPSLTGKIWTEKCLSNKDIPIEPIIAFQGSFWFMEKAFFEECDLMNDEVWGVFWSEAQEIVTEVFLRKGGECVINRLGNYFHLHKGKNTEGYDGRKGRGYHLREQALKDGRMAALRFYDGKKVWKDQLHPLSWLIEQFMPMPTWDADKIESLKERERKNGWK